jgi:asparagine synthase (glutamine-hydrolysing)
MCGLCLSVNDSAVDIRRLTECIKHRGPDSTGFYMDSHVACGFNRLAIIDSDPLSDQPMLDASRRYLLLFNGEIYNHNKLRDELEARHQIRFATRSDTEVLLDGLIAEGADFIRKLDGIYAFAFVDLETLEVLLARDVFGVKPLYYFSRADRLYVSSEIKPLRAISGTGLNVASMARYLSCGIAGDSDAVISGVHELSSNTIVRFRDGQVIGSARIHEFEFDGRDTASIDQIRDVLYGTIDGQKPQIPYGVLFSGGIDSTLVLERCLADDHFAGAYSLDVDHPDMSERAWQEYVIDKNQKRDQYIRVEVNKRDFSVANMADIASELDYPLFHPNFIGSFMLTRAAAKNGLKVLLSGEGADELFLGYRWFFSNDQASDFLEYVPLQDLQSLLGAPPSAVEAPETTLLETFQRVYLRRWLLRQDLTGMANSVEIRVPFLGADVAQLANGLAIEFKKRHGSKWLLRSLLAEKYPSAFLERKKMGFDFPLNDWIGEEHYRFLGQRADLFDGAKLRSILDKHEGSFMKNRIVFSLVALAHWLES